MVLSGTLTCFPGKKMPRAPVPQCPRTPGKPAQQEVLVHPILKTSATKSTRTQPSGPGSNAQAVYASLHWAVSMRRIKSFRRKELQDISGLVWTEFECSHGRNMIDCWLLVVTNHINHPEKYAVTLAWSFQVKNHPPPHQNEQSELG